MRGKILGLDKGVTGEVFELGEEKKPSGGEEPAEGGEEVPKPAEKKHIYISNVVKNEKMHYFKIPKLGAYLSVPLIYNCYLK